MMPWMTALIDWLKNVLTPLVNTFFLGVLLVLVGIIIGRIVSMFLQKFLHSANINKLVSQSTKSKAPVEQIISYFVRYFIYFVFIMLGLNTIGITTALLTSIGIVVLVIIVFSIFLGIKDFIPNAIAGLMLQGRGFLKKGDSISFDTVSGTILAINLTETLIKTPKGDTLFIPNSLLTSKEIHRISRKNGSKTSSKKQKD